MDIEIKHDHQKDSSLTNLVNYIDKDIEKIQSKKLIIVENSKLKQNYLVNHNYQKIGWHPKNYKLKEKLSNRCGSMSCYICDKEKTFNEISYCRIISYNQMPYLNQLETFNFEENINQEDEISKSENNTDKNTDKNTEKQHNFNSYSKTELNSIIKKTEHYNIGDNEKRYLKTLNEKHEMRKIRDKHNKNNAKNNDDLNLEQNNIWDDSYYFKRAENVYILCSDCVSKELMVRAPKNYKMVQDHYFNKNIEFMTLKNIQYELEFKQKSLLFQERLLKDDITNLKEKVKVLNDESKKIHKNVEIEENKFKMLNELKLKNEDIMNFLSSGQRQFSDNFNELMRSCGSLLSKTNESFWHLNKHIVDSNRETNKQVNMNIASLESLCDTQQVSHPCSLCYTSDINTAINPCGHTFCDKCINKLHIKKCPHCSASFQSVLKIYI